MREIQLTRGFVAIVDDEDYEFLAKSSWQASSSNGRTYATRDCHECRHKIFMHREVYRATRGSFAAHVDHKDGNTLDNRRENLRPCTKRQNNSNQRKRRQSTSSRFKGVTRRSGGTSWQAQIGYRNRNRYLGCFATEEEAARAYDREAVRLFGEFAAVNFPDAAPGLVAALRDTSVLAQEALA